MKSTASEPGLTRRVVILYLYERMNARRCKTSFLCNTLWVGENWKIERAKAAAKSCSISIHGSVKYPVKVSLRGRRLKEKGKGVL